MDDSQQQIIRYGKVLNTTKLLGQAQKYRLRYMGIYNENRELIATGFIFYRWV